MDILKQMKVERIQKDPRYGALMREEFLERCKPINNQLSKFLSVAIPIKIVYQVGKVEHVYSDKDQEIIDFYKNEIERIANDYR